MSVQFVTIGLSDPLYNQLQQRAQKQHRTIEAELLATVAKALPSSVAKPTASPETEPTLDTDLEAALSDLELLDDEGLWRAARSHLATEAAERLTELNLMRQREGLTQAETQELWKLARQYERAMLIRAQSTLCLQQRGYDVSGLVARP